MNKPFCPIEKTTRYATNVETLEQVWSFVMEHVDLLGSGTRPRINITPGRMVCDCSSPEDHMLRDDAWPHEFYSVSVEAMQEISVVAESNVSAGEGS